jgi:hypothetical protein
MHMFCCCCCHPSHLDVAVDKVLAVQESKGREEWLDDKGGSLNLWELAAL